MEINYLLCIVEIMTRYLYVRPLYKKSEDDVYEAFIDIKFERPVYKL